MSSKVAKRLSTYWKMELGCAFALPLCGWLIVSKLGDRIELLAVLAMLATSVNLVIGAACWRLALAHCKDERQLAESLMGYLARSPRLAKMAAVVGVLAGLGELLLDKSFTPSAILALVFGSLAALEYINYYVVQLQHFDHWNDFKRLLAGDGFRKPYLAKAIARHQAGNRGISTRDHEQISI